MNRWYLLFIIVWIAPVSAGAPFYQKKAEGWFWYEEIETPDRSPKILPEEKTLTATEEILQQRKTLEQKLHQAIITPSIENIKHYLYAQRAIMDQSQRFAENWQKVLLHYPDLDETRIHPVNQTARHLYLASEEIRKSEKLKKLAKDYGLFFFFKGECPFCEGFASTVKHFSQKYQWSILPISLDGKALKEFTQFKDDNGLAAQLNIATVPTLIALHTKTKQLIPLSFKMVSLAELEQAADKMLGAAP